VEYLYVGVQSFLVSISICKYRKQYEDRLKELEHKCNNLEAKNEELEQYGRRCSVRISRIPECPNDDTNGLVLDVAHQMGLNLNQSDINRSHRLYRKQGDN
jgi:hypothetical protein